MINFVCWRWGTAYTHHHVELLLHMLRKTQKNSWVLWCVDETTITRYNHDIDMPSVYGYVKPPWMVQPEMPREALNCFRRLWLLSAEARARIGDIRVNIDLDVVVVDDLTDLVLKALDRKSAPARFMFMRDPYYPEQFNGGLWGVSGNADFYWRHYRRSPENALRVSKRNRLRGSDQAWLTYTFGRAQGVSVHTRADGLLSYRVDIAGQPGTSCMPRAVFFHGTPKPWEVTEDNPWIQEAYA